MLARISLMSSSSDKEDPDLVLAHMKLEMFELKSKLKAAEGASTELQKSFDAAADQRYSDDSLLTIDKEY